MHLKELYRLYRFLKNQTPFFNPDQEMSEVMVRMTDDVEHRSTVQSIESDMQLAA